MRLLFGWVCPALTLAAFSQPRASSEDSNAAGSCDVAHVRWSIDAKQQTSAFEWAAPNCTPPLKHFGGGSDVAQLMEGRHILVVGNSMARILVNTLHRMFKRGSGATAIVDVSLASNEIPDWDHHWPKHGSSMVDLVLRVRRAHVPSSKHLPSHTGAQVDKNRVQCATWTAAFPDAAVSCCLASLRGKSKPPPTHNTARLSFAFTDSPSVPPIVAALRAWASTNRSSCAQQFAPAFVVLVLSPSRRFADDELDSVFAALDDARASNARLRETTVFLFVTRTDTSVPDDGFKARRGDGGGDDDRYEETTREGLARHEAAVARACAARDGHVRAVPVSLGSVDGIRSGALHHKAGSMYHFCDPGRYYLAHAVLNVMQQAMAP